MSSITSNDKRNTGFLVRFAFSVIIVALIATGSTATRVFANGYMSISKTETVQPVCNTPGGGEDIPETKIVLPSRIC